MKVNGTIYILEHTWLISVLSGAIMNERNIKVS